MNKRLSTILVLFILAISGCVPTQRTIYESRSEKRVEKIGLLSIHTIQTYDSVDMCGSGMISGVFDYGIVGQRHLNDFKLIMDIQRFDFAENLSEAIKRELVLSKYEVIEIPVNRKNQKEPLENYLFSNEVDAYLDIVPVFVGYNCKDKITSRLYKPRIIVFAKLVHAKSGLTLYANLINYGESSTSKAAHIDVDSKYVFSTFEDMVNRPEALLEAMEIGIDKIAKQINNDLMPTN